MTRKIVTQLFILIFGILFFCSDHAFAFPKVYSPIIEKGEIELEAEGSYNFDKRQEKKGTQEQKYAVGYGVTDRWATEIYGNLSNNPAERERLEFESIEWENRVQLFDQGQYWLDAGVYFSYEFAHEDQDPDEIEAKLLLEKQLGDFVHTANLILQKEVGGDTPDDAEKEKHRWEGGVAWSSRYRFKQYLEPGVEVHYNAIELSKNQSFNEQELQIGPTVYGKIGPVKYDIGYLFGVTDAAADGELKWIVEYELRF